jgi:hypothetical protein
MLSFTLQTNAQVPLTANVVDQLGGPAQAPESISWSVADETVAGLDGTHGSSVNLIAHAEGATTVAVTVGSLTTILHVTIVPMVASAVSIDIGTPVAKAAAPEVEHHAEAANDAEHAEGAHSPEHAESAVHEGEHHEHEGEHHGEAAPAEAVGETTEGETPKGEEHGREAAEHCGQPAHADEAAEHHKSESEAA